jgi:hypothetical protein
MPRVLGGGFRDDAPEIIELATTTFELLDETPLQEVGGGNFWEGGWVRGAVVIKRAAMGKGNDRSRDNLILERSDCDYQPALFKEGLAFCFEVAARKGGKMLASDGCLIDLPKIMEATAGRNLNLKLLIIS